MTPPPILPPPEECVAVVQPVGILIRVMWQLGRDTSHVPTGLEYQRSGQLEMDPDGQSMG